jgi:hypothetical protein
MFLIKRVERCHERLRKSGVERTRSDRSAACVEDVCLNWKLIPGDPRTRVHARAQCEVRDLIESWMHIHQRTRADCSRPDRATNICFTCLIVNVSSTSVDCCASCCLCCATWK